MRTRIVRRVRHHAEKMHFALNHIATPKHASILPKAFILFVITLVILIWRRPDQLIHPYIWVEEGTVTLPAYIHSGWSSLFSPVAGYLVIPAKLIFLLAASISFNHLVAIEYWLTVLFTYGVLATIAFSPSYLKAPFLCAIALLLIPTDAEVFAVSEYAFWWGSLLAVVALLWATDTRQIWRCALTIVGGLSSPLIIPLVALFGLKALRSRWRSDLIVFVVSLSVATVQYVVLKQHGAMPKSNFLSIDLELVVVKFFGMFSSNWQPFTFGCLALAVLGTGLARKMDFSLVLIYGCLAVSIIASIDRIPLNVIHPQTAGPRYFFFPYTFLSWSLIYIFSEGTTWLRATCVFLVALSLHQFVEIGQRHHIPINWEENIAACKLSDDYSLPVHFDGSSNMWHVDISGKNCQRLSNQSLLDH